MRSLRDYTRLKTAPPEAPDELAWSLVLDHLIFAAEAEVRWLDHVESRAGADRAVDARRLPGPEPPLGGPSRRSGDQRSTGPVLLRPARRDPGARPRRASRARPAPRRPRRRLGELVAVMGASGSGKSTLLNVRRRAATRRRRDGRARRRRAGRPGPAAPGQRCADGSVGIRVPGLQPDPGADRGRERRAAARARRRRDPHGAAPRRWRPRRGRAARPSPTASRTSCPAGSSSASRSRAPSSAPAGSCSPTNRRARSTR